jgi:hypothetical protein
MEEKTKSQLLEVKLEDEKKQWNATVKALVEQIRHVDNLAESQVLMLSYRHQLGDKSNEFKNMIARRKSTMWVARKEAYRTYKTQYDLKLNQSEINDFIDADTRETILIIAILENQLYYYSMTMDTLDKLGFAISNRITIAQRL